MPLRNLYLSAALLAFIAPASAGPKVLLQTNMGDITLELDDQKAPASSENFLQYVRSGAYDGTIFHRVIDGFMIQGGGFDTNFNRRSTGAPVENEADNGLKNRRGSIAMARTSNPHSATNQFFINVADNDFLDHRSKDAQGWGYAVFGQVVAGMDVVDRIRQLPTGPGGPFPSDAPQTEAVIEKASILEP